MIALWHNGRAVAPHAGVPSSKLARAALFFQVCYLLLGERILILPPKGEEYLFFRLRAKNKNRTTKFKAEIKY